MSILKDIIRRGLENWNIPYTEQGLDRLDAFSAQLVEKNKVMNLTAITDPEQIATKHMLDSLFLFNCHSFSGSCIDVGCGAGFPGLPLKLMRPDLDLTMLDARAKRIHFVQEVADSLSVPLTAVAARAEEYVRQNEHYEYYSSVISRAVAPLNVLAELCLPFLAVGGLFLAMKSDNADAAAEIGAVQNALHILGGEIVERRPYTLENVSGGRQIVIIQKTRSCPPKYPRAFAKISSKPL